MGFKIYTDFKYSAIIACKSDEQKVVKMLESPCIFTGRSRILSFIANISLKVKKIYNQPTNREKNLSHMKHSVQIKWKNERKKLDQHIYGQCI